MDGMRELTDSSKLSVRSCPETHDAIGQVRAAVAKARGKRPPIERVVNWAIHYVASLSAGELAEAMRIGEHRMEAGVAPPDAKGGQGGTGAKTGRRARPLRPGYVARDPSDREADDPKSTAPDRRRRTSRAD